MRFVRRADGTFEIGQSALDRSLARRGPSAPDDSAFGRRRDGYRMTVVTEMLRCDAIASTPPGSEVATMSPP